MKSQQQKYKEKKLMSAFERAVQEKYELENSNIKLFAHPQAYKEALYNANAAVSAARVDIIKRNR